MGVGHRPLWLGGMTTVVCGVGGGGGGAWPLAWIHATTVKQAAEGPGDWAGQPAAEAGQAGKQRRGRGETGLEGSSLWGWSGACPAPQGSRQQLKCEPPLYLPGCSPNLPPPWSTVLRSSGQTTLISLGAAGLQAGPVGAWGCPPVPRRGLQPGLCPWLTHHVERLSPGPASCSTGGGRGDAARVPGTQPWERHGKSLLFQGGSEAQHLAG